MTDETPSLDALRREIDEIDIAVHDLLMRRTSLGEKIGEVKGEGTAFIRPGREAQILRRLIARHSGPFPKVVVVRVWREIISALAALQGSFAVAVYVPAGAGEGLRALARAHYGSQRLRLGRRRPQGRQRRPGHHRRAADARQRAAGPLVAQPDPPGR
jgi:chorismate mutase-like protein